MNSVGFGKECLTGSDTSSIWYPAMVSKIQMSEVIAFRRPNDKATSPALKCSGVFCRLSVPDTSLGKGRLSLSLLKVSSCWPSCCLVSCCCWNSKMLSRKPTVVFFHLWGILKRPLLFPSRIEMKVFVPSYLWNFSFSSLVSFTSRVLVPVRVISRLPQNQNFSLIFDGDRKGLRY